MRKILGHVVRFRRIWDLYQVCGDVDVYEYEAFDGKQTLFLSEGSVVSFVDSSQEWIPAAQPRRL